MEFTNTANTDSSLSVFVRELSETLNIVGPDKTLHAIRSARYSHIGLNEELSFTLSKVELYTGVPVEEILPIKPCHQQTTKVRNAFGLFIYHAHITLGYTFGDLRLSLKKGKSTMHDGFKRIKTVIEKNNSMAEVKKKIDSDIENYRRESKRNKN